MIVRGPRPSDNFAQIHNAALADGRLSFKARGILAFLLSRPPGWHTSAERLAKSGIDGERAVKSGLKELEEHGYLQRSRRHAPDGTWIHEQVITDQPITISTKRTDGPDTTDPDVDTTGAFCTGGKRTDINNTSPNNTYSQDADAVVSPTQGEPAATPSRNPDEMNREGVGTPTPQRGIPEKPSKHGWMTERAWITAHEEVELIDVTVHATRYTIRCAEMNKKPSSPEWLRWLMDDEQKERAEERKQAKANGNRKKWYGVAGDE